MLGIHAISLRGCDAEEGGVEKPHVFLQETSFLRNDLRDDGLDRSFTEERGERCYVVVSTGWRDLPHRDDLHWDGSIHPG